MHMQMRIILSLCLLTGANLWGIEGTQAKSILTKGSGEWGPPGNDWGFGLYFTENEPPKYRFIGEGGFELPISYVIEQDKMHISLTREAISNSPKHYIKKLKPKTTCVLNELSNSLESLYQLTCDNKLILFGSEYPVNGLERKLGNYTIMTTGGYKAKAIETVKFRAAPGANAATISCTLINVWDAKNREYKGDSIPKSFEKIYVLGRTTEKHKIGNWENYWLYVMIGIDPHDGENCKKDFGWLYGEFVQPVK
jgi:hypothetical protein